MRVWWGASVKAGEQENGVGWAPGSTDAAGFEGGNSLRSEALCGLDIPWCGGPGGGCAPWAGPWGEGPLAGGPLAWL